MQMGGLKGLPIFLLVGLGSAMNVIERVEHEVPQKSLAGFQVAVDDWTLVQAENNKVRVFNKDGKGQNMDSWDLLQVINPPTHTEPLPNGVVIPVGGITDFGARVAVSGNLLAIAAPGSASCPPKQDCKKVGYDLAGIVFIYQFSEVENEWVLVSSISHDSHEMRKSTLEYEAYQNWVDMGKPMKTENGVKVADMPNAFENLFSMEVEWEEQDGTVTANQFVAELDSYYGLDSVYFPPKAQWADYPLPGYSHISVRPTLDGQDYRIRQGAEGTKDDPAYELKEPTNDNLTHLKLYLGNFGIALSGNRLAISSGVECSSVNPKDAGQDQVGVGCYDYATKVNVNRVDVFYELQAQEVWSYDRSVNTYNLTRWGHSAAILPPIEPWDAKGPHQGFGEAISFAGSTVGTLPVLPDLLAVGAPRAKKVGSGDSSPYGGVYLYQITRLDNSMSDVVTYRFQTMPSTSNGAQDVPNANCGRSVAVDATANYLAVACPTMNKLTAENTNMLGAVYVVPISSTEPKELTIPSALKQDDEFGVNVALSGVNLLVGMDQRGRGKGLRTCTPVFLYTRDQDGPEAWGKSADLKTLSCEVLSAWAQGTPNPVVADAPTELQRYANPLETALNPFDDLGSRPGTLSVNGPFVVALTTEVVGEFNGGGRRTLQASPLEQTPSLTVWGGPTTFRYNDYVTSVPDCLQETAEQLKLDPTTRTPKTQAQLAQDQLENNPACTSSPNTDNNIVTTDPVTFTTIQTTPKPTSEITCLARDTCKVILHVKDEIHPGVPALFDGADGRKTAMNNILIELGPDTVTWGTLGDMLPNAAEATASRPFTYVPPDTQICRKIKLSFTTRTAAPNAVRSRAEMYVNVLSNVPSWSGVTPAHNGIREVYVGIRHNFTVQATDSDAAEQIDIRVLENPGLPSGAQVGIAEPPVAGPVRKREFVWHPLGTQVLSGQDTLYKVCFRAVNTQPNVCKYQQSEDRCIIMKLITPRPRFVSALPKLYVPLTPFQRFGGKPFHCHSNCNEAADLGYAESNGLGDDSVYSDVHYGDIGWNPTIWPIKNDPHDPAALDWDLHDDGVTPAQERFAYLGCAYLDESPLGQSTWTIGLPQKKTFGDKAARNNVRRHYECWEPEEPGIPVPVIPDQEAARRKFEKEWRESIVNVVTVDKNVDPPVLTRVALDDPDELAAFDQDLGKPVPDYGRRSLTGNVKSRAVHIPGGIGHFWGKGKNQYTAAVGQMFSVPMTMTEASCYQEVNPEDIPPPFCVYTIKRENNDPDGKELDRYIKDEDLGKYGLKINGTGTVGLPATARLEYTKGYGPTKDRPPVTYTFKWRPIRGQETFDYKVCFKGGDLFDIVKQFLCIEIHIARCKYVAKDGDTLYSIAQDYDTDFMQLWMANAETLKNPGHVENGAELNIGVLYKVRKGDTLQSLAQRFQLHNGDRILALNPDMYKTVVVEQYKAANGPFAPDYTKFLADAPNHPSHVCVSLPGCTYKHPFSTRMDNQFSTEGKYPVLTTKNRDWGGNQRNHLVKGGQAANLNQGDVYDAGIGLLDLNYNIKNNPADPNADY